MAYDVVFGTNTRDWSCGIGDEEEDITPPQPLPALRPPSAMQRAAQLFITSGLFGWPQAFAGLVFDTVARAADE